jgi:hypothetical protein
VTDCDVDFFRPVVSNFLMDSPSPAIVAELLSAAEDMLNFGTHDGPCEFTEDSNGCVRHLEEVAKRSTRLSEAIKAFARPETVQS